MCRLLLVRSNQQTSIARHLKQLSQIARNSKEYQGHGWGLGILRDGQWKSHKSIKPIWEDNLEQFGETCLFIAHARSAFKDEGIIVENNMPFFDKQLAFIFNGELRGVRLKEQGRIGAEKIFNFVKRFCREDISAGTKKGMDIITKRTKYVRAMNIILCNQQEVCVYTSYNEDPDYFTVHYREGRELIISSEPYPEDDSGWIKLENKTCRVF